MDERRLRDPVLPQAFCDRQVSLTESLNEASALQDEDGFPEIMETMVNFEQFDEYLRGPDQYSPSARCAIEEDYFAKAGEEFVQGDHGAREQYDLGSHAVPIEEQHFYAGIKSEIPTPELHAPEMFFSSVDTPSSVAPSSVAPSSVSPYEPKTRARKYRRKTAEEKFSETYKAKREKNNDAVRRSRSKTKQMQSIRDEELNRLTEENAQLREELAGVKQKNGKLVSENNRLRAIVAAARRGVVP